MASNPVGWVILGIILVIILIVIIIITTVGTLAFFVAMPGMVVEKITKFLEDNWVKVKSLVIGLDKASVNNKNITDVAQYLKNMGYDLEGCGFVDRRGKITYETTNSPDEEAKISKIDSQYIWSYLVAENRTYLIRNHNWNLSSIVNSLKNSILNFDWLNTNDFGVGMLNIDEKWWGIFDGHVSVDREKKILTIEDNQYTHFWFIPWYTHTEVYHYNLEGWTGRYGKPLEFLLSVHLATMAPDLAYQLALDPDLDAKVNISFQRTNTTFSFRYKVDNQTILTPDEIRNYPTPLYIGSKFGSNAEIADELETKTVEIRTPYITSVTDHWFRDVYFRVSGEKEVVIKEKAEDEDYWDKYDKDGNLQTEKISGIDVYEIGDTSRDEYEIDLKDLSGKVLVTEYRAGNIIQRADARRGITNPKIKKMFKEQKYYIYDGTIERANEIKEAAKGNGTLEKDYVNIDKDSLAVFSMLENTHTVDADYIYKDFKELLIELEYFTREDFIKQDKHVFRWFIKGYTPKEWPERKSDKEVFEYGTKVSSKAEVDKLKSITNEEYINKGFDSGKEVLSPCVGEIVDKGSDYITIKVLDNDKISEYKDFYNKYKDVCAGYTIDIRGITSITSKKIGEYVEEEEEIAKTTDQNIILVFKDLDEAIVENIEEYFNLNRFGEILEIAEQSHKYVRENGFTYGSHSNVVEIGNLTNSTIDCSSFVTWVVYQMGYTELNSQRSSAWWKNSALKEYPEWQRIEISDVEPGDILVVNNIASGGKDHHVEIYAGNGRSYSCGGNSSIKAAETVRTNMGRYEFAIRITPKM